MKIQEALSNCCEGVRDFASAAATWIGKTVSNIGSFLSDSVAKIAEFVKPYFEKMKVFAQQNKQPIIIAAIAFTAGSIITAVVSSLYNRTTTTTIVTPPAPNRVVTP